MKTRIIFATAILGITTTAPLVYAGAEENENKQKVEMRELPAAVQKTIQDNLGGGAITETAKETKGDKTYYEAQVQKSGGEKGRDQGRRGWNAYPCWEGSAGRGR